MQPAADYLLAALIDGDYDNTAQVALRAARGETAMPHVSLRIVRIAVPAIGERLFYAEWRSMSDAKIIRQRLYQPIATRRTGETLLRVWIWPTDPAFVAKTAAGFGDPRWIAALRPEDFVLRAGCDIVLQRKAGAFRGAMRAGTCTFPPGGDRPAVFSRTEMTVSNRTITYLDRWYRLDGSLYRQFSPESYKFERVSAKAKP